MDASPILETQMITSMIIKLLKDANLSESAHMLEKESSVFFDMNYFETMILEGKFKDVETYLSGFTQLDDNQYSVRTYFEIRKQKFLEVLDRHERDLAIDIVTNEFKDFNRYSESMFYEATQLFGLDDFRKHKSLLNYGPSKQERHHLVTSLKPLLQANPKLQGKLKFYEGDTEQNALLGQLLSGDLASSIQFQAQNDSEASCSIIKQENLKDDTLDKSTNLE